MEMDGMSMDIEKNEREKLKRVFPECFVEDKLDIDKLLNMCGEYITNDFEKYKFEWKGKSECLQLAQRRSTGTLRPVPAESVNFEDTQNVYIKGDNLEVLKLLQTAYYRQVKMIYIDPPYNTGNDFVYEDDFADPLVRYKEVTAQATKSNPETMGRFHTNWLNMMYPRLRLAANLLRDDGVCFISIDDNEVHNLRKLCDEVFGEENLLSEVIWDLGTGTTAGHFARSHEYILVYAKDRQSLKNFDAIEDTNICHGALKKISKANPASEITFPAGVEFEGSDAVFKGEIGGSEKEYIISDKMVFENGKLKFPVTIKAGWGMKNQVLDWLDGKETYDSKGQKVVRFYFNKQGILWYEKERGAYNPKSVISGLANTKNGTTELRNLMGDVFLDFPKPVELIKYLLLLGTNTISNNDIVLDFFSGSATTAHAVMQLNAEDGGNRRFIMVQLPEVCDEKSEAYKAGYKNICEIGMERIRRAGRKILAEQDTQIALGEEEKLPIDIGFKVFELDYSNLKTWDGTPVKEDALPLLIERMNGMIDRVKHDRSDLDVVYEIMLKLGVPLTYPVAAIDIGGIPAYSIGDDCLLLICLAEGVTPEIMEEMCEYAPAKLILSKNCLGDATAMANAHYICNDRDIELKLV